ncbi:E3 ubiquitin-protein ligase znrf2 [Tyrophagus putrescentiae]|nr:E3 ubiquitin-protein ligase znrf2 [Tyrophagus putrescentiae]
MGSKQSTANSPSRIVSRGENSSTIGGSFSSSTPFRSGSHTAEATEQLNNGRDTNWRQRARSLTAVISSDSRPSHSSAIDVLSPFGFKCPFCSKTILPDDVECHLVMCITKPQLNYNEDILRDDKEECVICLEEMLKGNKIARLPCLCIYHKQCIDAWFEVNRSCPEHPAD